MAAFGVYSRTRLVTCDPRLQQLFNEVVKHFDCRVLCGHRTEAEQNQALHDGYSKLAWPLSKHNTNPSMAVDVVPWPVDWEDRERMVYFAGLVKGVALGLGLKVRWGGDWDSDTEVMDEKGLRDLPHFELVP